MMNSTKSSLTVQAEITAVVRSAGERTKELCYRLLCDQLPPENIVVIEEYPFTSALRKSFQMGIELGRPWTLCVDADTLLRRKSALNLLTWGLATESCIFQIQCDVFDKLFAVPKKAGVRLYRTSLLPRAIACIPADGVSQRPETMVRDQMTALGYPSLYKRVTVGLHDFEQYYRDLYRKAFVHAHKHDWETQSIEPLWQKLSDRDPDYKVALRGLRDGRLFKGIVPLDVRFFSRDISSLLDIPGFHEKDPFASTDDARSDTDKVILQYGQMRVSIDSKPVAKRQR